MGLKLNIPKEYCRKVVSEAVLESTLLLRIRCLRTFVYSKESDNKPQNQVWMRKALIVAGVLLDRENRGIFNFAFRNTPVKTDTPLPPSIERKVIEE